MEQKQISCDRLPSRIARYQSFIAKELPSYDINVLHGRRIRACFHGWVILSNRPDNVLWSLWNPLTSTLIRLPPLINKTRASYECCLSSPPYDQRSVFLLFPKNDSTIVFCRLDRKQKKLKWVEMSYAKQLLSLDDTLHDTRLQCLTCYKGNVYAITTNWYMFVVQVDIVVKAKEVVISIVRFVELPYTCLRFHTNYPCLKGSSTNLFYIQVYMEDATKPVEVRLFKLDIDSMTWEAMAMEDLRDDVLLLEFRTDDSCSVFYKAAVASEIGGGGVHIVGKMDILTSFYAKYRTVMPCIEPQNHVFVWAMLESRSEFVGHEEDKENEIFVRHANCDETELDSSISESRLLNIPFHMLEMIMQYCVGVEYMRFRATCKHCNIAAPLIQWSSETSLRRLEMYSIVSPWFMILDNDQGMITFIDPICGDRYFKNIPTDLDEDYQIYCSRYGWLLMYDNIAGSMAFFNPCTCDVRELPEARLLDSVCFSAPPTSPNCMVVGFRRLSINVYIHFVSQEPTWRKYNLDFGYRVQRWFRFPTFMGPDIYALCDNVRIQAFGGIDEEVFGGSSVTVVDKAPISCCKSTPNYFLSNCDEHVFLVIVGAYGESVEVFKQNHSTNEWEKIDGLGKHMIYISENSCICVEAKSPEVGNKIYFPRSLDEDDRKMVFYSLETCRYHTFDNKNIQESFGYDLLKATEYHYPCAWIEPSWS